MGKTRSKRGGRRRRRIVVVVGMHRSGTSVLARGLQALGVDLGTELVPPAEDNPSGFWENGAIVQLDDELLAAQGLAWDSACVFPATIANRDEFHKRARDLIQSLSGDAPLFGFKDPRTARLLGFWQPVFGELGLGDSYVLIVRNPEEVVASLQARNKMLRMQGLLLWAFHYLDALAATEGRARVLVDYDDLVAQPASELRRIAEGLALPLDATSSDAIESYGREFVNLELRHHHGSNVAQDQEPVSRSVFEMYRTLRAVAHGEMTLESDTTVNAIDTVRNFVVSAAPLLERAARGGQPARPGARENTQGTWAARLDPHMSPALSVGERVHVEVICTNDGTRTWTPVHPEGPQLKLSYHVRYSNGTVFEWDGLRTPLAHRVEPGQQVRLQAEFTAPGLAGDYLVEWDMLSESESWFQQAGSLTAVVPLRVTAFDKVEPGRYPVHVIPKSSWSPRFRKPVEDVRVAIAVRAWNVIKFNRRELFGNVLDSLGKAGHPFDLFIVDNGSTDGTAELVTERGGYAAPRVGEQNGAGHGMNIAIERALTCQPDLVVFSDDDVVWHPGFLRRIVEIWAGAPHDLGLLSGYLEPRWPWNAISEALDCGTIRAIVRETAPGGAWTFPAAHWRWIGPLQPGMDADAEACLRLRRSGFRIAQADLASHVGAGHSTWGNEPPSGGTIDDSLFRHGLHAPNSIADESNQYQALEKAIGERDVELSRLSQTLAAQALQLTGHRRVEAALHAEHAESTRLRTELQEAQQRALSLETALHAESTRLRTELQEAQQRALSLETALHAEHAESTRLRSIEPALHAEHAESNRLRAELIVFQAHLAQRKLEVQALRSRFAVRVHDRLVSLCRRLFRKTGQ